MKTTWRSCGRSALALLLAFLLAHPQAFAQTGSPMPVTHIQFHDVNGAPLAGGFVYTCTAGAACTSSTIGGPPTANGLVTYKDAIGTANTNPVVLDAGGFGDFWLGSTGPYKIVVQDQNGVQQSSSDNVPAPGAVASGISTTLLAALAATTGATLIGVLAPGGTARTVAAKLGDWVSALDYPGADIGAQINAGIAALGTGGGTIFIPKGVYTFSTPINADNTSGCKIKGDGGITAGAQATTKLIYTGTSTPFSARSSYGFTYDELQLVTTNAAYAGTTIDLSHSSMGNDTAFATVSNSSFFSNNGGAASIIIDADDAIVCDFHNLNLQNYNVGILGVAAAGHYSNGIKLDHIHFSSSSGSAVTAHIQNPGSGWVITNPTFEMGSAAGTPKAIYCSSASIGGQGVQLDGMWLGDTGSGSQALIDICGGGWSVSGGSIAGDNSTTAFNLMTGVWGINITGVTISNHAVAFGLNGNLGLHEVGNVFSSVAALSTGSVGTGIVQNLTDYGQALYGPTILAGATNFTSSAKFSGTVTNSGTALKHMTICASGCTVTQTPCSTSAVVGNTCVSVATWPGSAFADTNYTAVCSAKGAVTGVPIVSGQSVNTTQVAYQIQAVTTAVATVSEVDCIGIHP